MSLKEVERMCGEIHELLWVESGFKGRIFTNIHPEGYFRDMSPLLEGSSYPRQELVLGQRAQAEFPTTFNHHHTTRTQVNATFKIKSPITRF